MNNKTNEQIVDFIIADVTHSLAYIKPKDKDLKEHLNIISLNEWIENPKINDLEKTQSKSKKLF